MNDLGLGSFRYFLDLSWGLSLYSPFVGLYLGCKKVQNVTRIIFLFCCCEMKGNLGKAFKFLKSVIVCLLYFKVGLILKRFSRKKTENSLRLKARAELNS